MVNVICISAPFQAFVVARVVIFLKQYITTDGMIKSYTTTLFLEEIHSIPCQTPIVSPLGKQEEHYRASLSISYDSS